MQTSKQKIMKILSINYLLFASLIVGLFSCTDDLDVAIEDPDQVVADQVYEDLDDYLSGLAKIYAGFATTGQQGPAGQPDISEIDEGASQYLRQYWTLQEIPTDEAVIGWLDGNLPDMNTFEWSSNNEFIQAMYYRIYFTVAAANEFIRESTPEKLSSRGITGTDAETVAEYRAEARFLRALAYMHGIDLFGDLPLITDEDPVGFFFPEKVSRSTIFEFIESEIMAIEGDLIAPQSVYGRADKAAAWMLLSKLYLNAEVYIGENRYTDALTYLNQVIGAGYQLDDDYDHLFMADNHTSPEMIFPIVFDGDLTRTFGGTTFLAHAPVGGSMAPSDYGIDGGWAGIRTTRNHVLMYPFNDSGDYTSSPDDRANFYTDGLTLEMPVLLDNFLYGLAKEKFINITSDGQPGKRLDFVDTDFPIFRLGDAYLMYAEAVLRGGSGGDTGTAVNYVNQLRERAYGNSTGNISSSDLTLDFVLEERSRELHWEGHRRSDLIRFDMYTDNYVWPWKGGSQAGANVSEHLELYPIPASELNANPSITQNPGY